MWREERRVAGERLYSALILGTDSTEDELDALLGESARSLSRRLPEPPWLDVVRACWGALDEAFAPSGCLCSSASANRSAADSDAALQEWLEPLAGWARRRLAAQLRAESSTPDDPADELPDGHALFVFRGPALTAMTKQVLVEAQQSARDRGLLCGSNGEERFACFSTGLRDRQVGLSVLAEYPVLARELVAYFENAVAVRAEFCRRFRMDAAALQSTFGLAAAGLRSIADITFDNSDPHRGGRSVAIVRTATGKVVYKPRPLAMDRHFRQLIEWVNARGLRHPLVSPATLDRGAYGWVSFVEQQACDDASGVRRFYWRHGAHAALFYALRAYDMHMYNVIAAGEQPVFVDLEAMFHSPAPFEDQDGGGVVGKTLRESVLATHVLPQLQVLADADGVRALDLSAMTGGFAGRNESLRAEVAFTAEGTDRMDVMRRRAKLPPGRHLPWPANESPQERIPSDEVLAGFASCYRILLAHRDALLADEGPIAAFAGDSCRAVLRSTSEYKSALSESWHPDLLRNSLDRELHLTTFVGSGALRDETGITASEFRQLSNGDVPLFTGHVADTSLADCAGVLHESFFAASGLDSARQRIRRLSETDLSDQLWFMRAALAGAAGFLRRRAPHQPQTRGEIGWSSDLALDAARSIADRLVTTALRETPSEGPEWVSLDLLDERYWVVGRTSLGLGSGVAGIALYLAELDAVVHEPRYREIAEDVVRGLLGDDEPPAVDDLAGMSIGAFEDLGSLVYLVTRLERLWETPLAAAMDWLLPAITHNAGLNPAGHVIGGLAGTGLVLAQWRRSHPSPSADAALRELDRALRTAERPSGAGLGYGSAGYAFAMAVLAEAIGNRDAADSARAALAPTRQLETRLPSLHAVGWSGGLAGEVLVRAAMLDMPSVEWSGAQLVTDLRACADRLVSDLSPDGPVLRDHCLGTGTMGVVEALATTATVLGDDRYEQAASRIAAHVASSVLGGRSAFGTPDGVWTPGLLRGGAGIGYGLLRAAAPDRVPDILTLGAPFRRVRSGDADESGAPDSVSRQDA